ncbi:MAG: FapA family protein [Lachnospiraceae bacterium]|nr:FapA family protein [Lachnospiraceae bacterium]
MGNGYAQLVVKNDVTYVKVMPASNQGRALDISDLTNYLDKNLLTDYNIKELANLCNEADGSTEVRVGAAPFRPFDEMIDMEVSLDKMYASCRMFPPSEGGALLGEEDIIKHLMQNRVKRGVDRDAIRSFLANRQYNTEYIFAKGIPVREGKDGEIKYLFNTSLNTKPATNPDGTVDYHHLNTVSLVKKGQVLATLTKADYGQSGTTIFGEEVKPHSVSEVQFDYGNNITVSEDGMSLISDVDGHANLVDKKVFVSNVLEIPADVDTSTGDIEYAGSVLIKGNVKSGFKVSAQGDVIVEGVVEGAVISCDGQIIIKRGVHGMNKGVLDCKGNIICKFIENAKVFCGGYLETEGILHSKVSVYSEIKVRGKKSMVAGGVIRAGYLIDVLTLGSEMGAQTLVEVGVNPGKKARYLEMKEVLGEKTKEGNQLKTILKTFQQKLADGVQLSPDKMVYLKKIASQYKELSEEIKNLSEKLEVMHQEISESKGARVKVEKDVYQGVTITISDVSTTTKGTRAHCQFVCEGGEIVVKNL